VIPSILFLILLAPVVFLLIVFLGLFALAKLWSKLNSVAGELLQEQATVRNRNRAPGQGFLMPVPSGRELYTAALYRLVSERVSFWRPSRRRSATITWGLVELAIGRLPEALSTAEKERWAEEMRADVAAVPGRMPRLLLAFRLWRKGAPEMPVGAEGLPRSTAD
jgi:hypothetical protein